MAHYFLADNSVPIMVEDGQQICTVDGQSFHLILQDVNNGVNGSANLIAYPTTTVDNSETTIYTQALLGQHSTASFDQGQNVYIINTEDFSLQRSPQKTELPIAQVQTKDNTSNIVRFSQKGSVSNMNDRQPIQWIGVPENNAKSQSPITMRNQTQRIASALSHLEQGTSDRMSHKMPKNRGRLSAPATALTESSDEINTGPMKTNSNKNLASTSRLKNVGSRPGGLKPSPRQPIRADNSQRGAHNFGVSRNPPALHYPPMESLSERIKQARMQTHKQPSSQQPLSGPSNLFPKLIRVNQNNRSGLMPPTTKQIPVRPPPPRSPDDPSDGLCQNTPSSPDKMEVGFSNSSPEKIQQEPASPGSDADANSESFAYLQKVIDSPANTIVQHQITGNTVKMLVVLPTGEQRLITFDLPNEDCTVQDLLEQAQIPFNGETVVSLVTDTTLNINYIVESEAGTIATLRDTSDTSDRESNSIGDNINAPALDENSHSPLTRDEEPRFIDGMLAVCPNCGISSMDFNRCIRCKKKLEIGVKQVPMDTNAQQKRENLMAIDNFYKKKSEMTNKFDTVAKRGRGGVRRAVKVKPFKEPECLTLSSDEEDDGSGPKKSESKKDHFVASHLMNSAPEEPERIVDKEPIITNHSIQQLRAINSEGKGGLNNEMNGDGLIPKTTSLQCRTVRIGSYKYAPHENVVINETGLRLSVPLLEDDKSFVNINVKMADIIKVLIHFGKGMPVLFFYTSVSCAATIRELLGMQDAKGPYYDPAGKDHTHKRITLLPEKITEESKIIFKALFLPGRLLEELDSKEANDILLRASPKDNSQMLLLKKNQFPQITATNGRQEKQIVQKMTVYPPPPAKGGIAINTEDYACLAEDQFLNDVIIDFYLKYLTLEKLSEVDQQRTHVFSSYFYKRLTSRHAQSGDTSTNQSPAAKRHARVQKWTKNVNIFEKDFIIIPINEHAHWFLAIICFPGLVGTVIPPPSPVKDSEAKKNKKMKEVKLQSVTIGSTTITQVATTITIDQADDDSERDEAEGDDEEMDLDSDDEDESELTHDESIIQESPDSPEDNEKGIVKSPCILIFDSLAGASRSRVVATLRDYLTCEHVAKMGVEKTFSKDTIKGGCPKIPQQSNFTDCGLYLLQYVENFFKEPIRNYILPIKSVKNWFEEIVVTRKREELSNLLIKLMNETKGDKNITLPTLQFPTQDGKLKPKPEGSEKTDSKAQKIEVEVKRKSADEEKNAQHHHQQQQQQQQQQESLESAAEINPRPSTTIYTIVGCSPSLSTNTNESNPMDMLVDVAPKPSSTGSTLAYLKNKRIPRLMSRDSEIHENQVAAKKYKGDFFDSCK